ncbi:uncharacterized protein (UPF0548 family) [Motilibacter rhizosphaerae]|uniref:Uncharacterized protein (UPF0548 family) n=1 Tax=Motilibacter rhizosphaerae TaxID=598652 RepID=A0A4Q7NAB6_9ACTN|nr:DUF1990 domain-containing protein [Motilibacter rhizosphaerae]RZS79378.1 uncharacterized protein (UPF0548 family) [Motilibacter rhizosphaerae]
MPRPLSERSATYDEVGATCPAEPEWRARPRGYRSFERTVVVGHGEHLWRSASAALLAWEVKTCSGFEVHPAGRVRTGQRLELLARIGPLRLREPVFIAAVVDEPDRRGFAYGTLDGHPVAGEEAFVLHREGDEVWLTLRSLTRPPRGRWRLAFPAVLVAQRVYRRRYARALRP